MNAQWKRAMPKPAEWERYWYRYTCEDTFININIFIIVVSLSVKKMMRAEKMKSGWKIYSGLKYYRGDLCEIRYFLSCEFLCMIKNFQWWIDIIIKRHLIAIYTIVAFVLHFCVVYLIYLYFNYIQLKYFT